jgi:hypothetical protein
MLIQDIKNKLLLTYIDKFDIRLPKSTVTGMLLVVVLDSELVFSSRELVLIVARDWVFDDVVPLASVVRVDVVGIGVVISSTVSALLSSMQLMEVSSDFTGLSFV